MTTPAMVSYPTLQYEDYQALLDGSHDAVIVASQHQQLIYCNARAREFFQEHPEVVLQTSDPWVMRLWSVDPKLPLMDDQLPLRQVLAGEKLQGVEYWLERPGTDQDSWLSISGAPMLLPSTRERVGVVIIRDMTAQKQAEESRLRHALQDELTGLPNRGILMDRLTQAVAQAALQPGYAPALALIDLDRFKAVNDTLGHAIGNQLLRQLAQRMQACLRPEDTLARMGGDEFAVLLDGVTSPDRVTETVERLCKVISSPFQLQGHEIYIDASIGVVVDGADYHYPEDLVWDAGIALHQAKDAVETCYRVFDNTMQLKTDNSLDVEMALRKAIPNQELVLFYQPIVLLRSQEVIGFEALVRWNHPQEGLLPPPKFIPIAENTGLIIPLGWWVLQEACRQMQVWKTQYPGAENMFVSVNMSSKQFTQKNLVEKIREILEETGLESKHLKLEITESVLIDHSDSIITTLSQIRELGIKLSIDDFGTGYSSLSYLHRFPFDALKIDRSFIEDADKDYEKLEILQSVVRLAWNLGLEVVAEGVETQRNYAQLKALRCESGQGYLFSRPLDPQKTEELIARQSQQGLKG